MSLHLASKEGSQRLVGTDDEEKVNGKDGDGPFGDSFDDHECSCIEGDLPDGQGDDSDGKYNKVDIVLISSTSRYDREYRKTYGRKYAQKNVHTWQDCCSAAMN